MKKTKSVASIFLTVVMIFGLSVFGSAQQPDNTGDFTALCYNVSGLPDINWLLGKENAIDVMGNQLQLSKMLKNSFYDIIAVQEDFTYHTSLVKYITNYDYKTNHSGGIPGGDGMNIFSKMPIYNEERTTWNTLYGVIANGADEMTAKGILYTVIDLGNGVLVDFYDIHADAYGDEGSIEARRDNFNQLAAIIESRGDKRPVIVTGDFNTSSSYYNDCGLTETLIYGCGLKDAWTELYNSGDYEDYSYYFNKYGTGWQNSWGKWDSVEKFLYKDGGGIKLEPESFEYLWFENSEKVSYSDHAAASVKFTYEITEDFTPNTEPMNVVRGNSFKVFIQKIKYIFTDLYKVFNHLDELKTIL